MCMRTEVEWNVQLGSTQLGKKCYLYTIESSKSWSWRMFSRVCVILDFSQQCSLVRCVQVLKPFIKIFWFWFVLLFQCTVLLYHKIFLLWNIEGKKKITGKHKRRHGKLENEHHILGWKPPYHKDVTSLWAHLTIYENANKIKIRFFFLWNMRIWSNCLFEKTSTKNY